MIPSCQNFSFLTRVTNALGNTIHGTVERGTIHTLYHTVNEKQRTKLHGFLCIELSPTLILSRSFSHFSKILLKNWCTVVPIGEKYGDIDVVIPHDSQPTHKYKFYWCASAKNVSASHNKYDSFHSHVGGVWEQQAYINRNPDITYNIITVCWLHYLVPLVPQSKPHQGFPNSEIYMIFYPSERYLWMKTEGFISR